MIPSGSAGRAPGCARPRRRAPPLPRRRASKRARGRRAGLRAPRWHASRGRAAGAATRAERRASRGARAARGRSRGRTSTRARSAAPALPTARRSSISARAATGARPPARPLAPTLLELADDHAGVVAAEAERVVDRDIDVRLARLVRHVVEIALGILELVVDRRRQHALVHGEGREERLDRAGAAEAVAGRALRARDGDAV